MADFPTSIFSQRTLTNAPGQTFDPTKTTRLYAEDIQQLGDEVTAIETILGENPQGDYSTVSERIAAAGTGGGGSGSGEPLTNGDVDSPELLFAAGDIIIA